MTVKRSVALAAALVCYAYATTAVSTPCHPAYSSGTTYAQGDWVSASFTAARLVKCSPPGVDDCPEFGLKPEEGEVSVSEMYNYQCKSDDNSKLCSNDEYAPGSIFSEQAWVRDSSPCSSVSII
jgi:hypothetical protein